jgi:hypothetical protein
MTGLYTPNSYSQKPAYICTLANDAITSDNSYEFDIYLLRTGTEPFELGGFELGVLYNKDIRNGGTLTATYIPGSVDQAIIASGQQNTIFKTEIPGLIKILPKLASKGHGTGAIISNQTPGTRIGRLRLTNSIPFSPFQPNIALNFNIKTYRTLIAAYIGGN